VTPLRCAAPARWLLAFSLSIALAGCQTREAPDNGADTGAEHVSGKDVDNASLPGTPMAQRVAVIGLLNKRNGNTRKLSMKPGEALRVDNAIVRLRACETTAPWEEVPETGAFVQLDVRESRDNQWHRVFSGWLFKERPDRNVVQHPIYDVWVMSCAMSWPETGDETVKLSARTLGEGDNSANSASGNASDSSAPQSAGASSSSSAPSAASNSAE
jgi:hypothetical protein